jgi:thiosulfate reductase cytochrome b subunit
MTDQSRPVAHSLPVRVTHWVNAFAVIMMILSGWGIYNASPLFGFEIPHQITIGGPLQGSIAWHFAMMWLLAANLLVYLVYGLVSGHLRRRLLPIRPAEIARDIGLALRSRLAHVPGRYNAVQRLSYVGVLLLIVAEMVTGLAMWKPVQLRELTVGLGGFEVVRIEHFAAMAGIVAFIGLHLVLVAKVPATLRPMISGQAAEEQG